MCAEATFISSWSTQIDKRRPKPGGELKYMTLGNLYDRALWGAPSLHGRQFTTNALSETLDTASHPLLVHTITR